jgi:hypothetical protein
MTQNQLPGKFVDRTGIRIMLTTADAAALLNREPQTLRKWACLENGPIRPIRVNGRLAWPADQIAALLNGGVNA